MVKTFLALYVLEGGIFLLLLCLYRSATRPDFSSFVLSTPGKLFLFALLLIIFSGGFIIYMMKMVDPLKKRRIHLWMGMNLVMLVLLVGCGEIVARSLSKQETISSYTIDQRLMGRSLYPSEWAQVAANINKVIDRMDREDSYLVHDPILGWTVAPSRTYDGYSLWYSSADGLRSPRLNMTFANLKTRHQGVSADPATFRVALVGDSFTFGDEVRCEESWGHLLETFLQPHVQVLNFGVNAYGLNQALLRYEKDAYTYRPQIVLIGIYGEMIRRINNTYVFLKNPEYKLPFARPRLVMDQSFLRIINSPVPSPREIVSHTSLDGLPYLDLDDYYRPFRWERGGAWSLLAKSYLFRFAYSFRPPSDDQEKEREEKALPVGEFLIQDFVRKVSDNGAVPLVVYHPSREELLESTMPENSYLPLPVRLLRNAGIEYFDSRPCLSTLDASEAYYEGRPLYASSEYAYSPLFRTGSPRNAEYAQTRTIAF